MIIYFHFFLFISLLRNTHKYNSYVFIVVIIIIIIIYYHKHKAFTITPLKQNVSCVYSARYT